MMMGRLSALLAPLLLVAVIACLSGVSATEQSPGMPPHSSSDSLANVNLEQPQSVTSLQPVYTKTGKIVCSINGRGSVVLTTYPVTMNKPSASATVEDVFFYVATTYTKPSLNAALGTTFDVNGQDVTLFDTVSYTYPYSPSTPGYNYRADIKAQTQATLNAAPAGPVDLLVEESGTNGASIDGVVIVVIWNEPSADPTTVILLYGHQAPAGDAFQVTFSDPLGDLSNSELDLHLGISFGYQPGGQYSTVTVNGQLITSSAGHNDDGDQAADGSLITVGGDGDSNDNPIDPNATNDQSDDELYSLKPFVQPGDTQIVVHTTNPSDNDNIFFAAFKLTNQAAIIGAGIVLGPLAAVNPVGTTHTVTATVQDDNNTPIVGVQVDFVITAGPNAGKTFSANTDAAGQASWTYTGDGGAGTDTIRASFYYAATQTTIQSNAASKTWEAAQNCNNAVTCMPSFETNNPADCQYNVLGKFCLQLSPFQFGPGGCWKVQSGEVDLKSSAYWVASHGDKSVDLNGRTAGHLVSKQIDLPAGDHVLSFDLGGNVFHAADKSMRAQILDAGSLAVLAQQPFTHVQPPAQLQQYARKQVAFTLAAAASIRIGFLSTTNIAPQNYYGPVVDNVDIRPANCPPA